MRVRCWVQSAKRVNDETFQRNIYAVQVLYNPYLVRSLAGGWTAWHERMMTVREPKPHCLIVWHKCLRVLIDDTTYTT